MMYPKKYLLLVILYLLNVNLVFPMIYENYQQDIIRNHPITHESQHYFVPSDCENGDNIGKVYELWTDRRFNNRGGQAYNFEIVGGNSNNAFRIEMNTGELVVNNSSAIKSDFVLDVRVSIGQDFQITKALIKWVDSKNIIYFDSQFSGNSNGSRSAPYKNFKDSNLRNGLPGKVYLFRRSRKFEREYIKIFNGKEEDRIIISSWGKGERPKMDGAFSTSQRFIDLGEIYSSKDENKSAYNVTISDLEIINYKSNAIRLTRWGKNFRFSRLKFDNFETNNGVLQLMANIDFKTNLYPSEIYISDIELYNFLDRGVKIERGGVVVENLRSITLKSNSKAPVSPTMMPGVMMRYIDAESNGGTGPNLRQYSQNIEWAYLKGFSRAIFLSATANAIGSFGPWLLNNNFIRNVIIDGTINANGIFFESMPGATNSAENIEISRVIIKNANKDGIFITNKVKNININYCLIYGSGEYGIKIDSGTDNIILQNNIVVNNKLIDIKADVLTNVSNSIFIKSQGLIKERNNFKSIEYFVDMINGNFRPNSNAPYLGKGVDFGYKFDLDHNPIPSPPSIGAYELYTASPNNGSVNLMLKSYPLNAGKISILNKN